MSMLERSWGSFSERIAKRYLKTYGFPSETSKQLLGDVLEEMARKKFGLGKRELAILDLGCGNAQLYEYFRERELPCRYTGVDFSEPLLEVARETTAGDDRANFVHADVNDITCIDGLFDVVLYSHVMEILSSPERSLRHARALAPIVIIRFFEPPEFEEDTVELRELEVEEDADGNSLKMPYLRRQMSRDHYRLILARLDCSQVDVYRDGSSKDQIHVLRFS
jgi:ubiquinone/menaquinone biosynthesis C-methylase UbiE